MKVDSETKKLENYLVKKIKIINEQIKSSIKIKSDVYLNDKKKFNDENIKEVISNDFK